MKKPVLVIMAAGLGSRFGGGGMKQVAPVDGGGRIMMDYAIFDAARAGFEDVICVVKPEAQKDFEETIGARVRGRVNMRYAHQTMQSFLPEGFSAPEGRTKPWGTAHAALCAKPLVNGPFAVINADDFYGAESYRLIYDFLTTHGPREHAMAGYTVENTLTENGSVARGVCRIGGDGCLEGITERTSIERRADGRIFFDEGGALVELPLGTVVSLNMWGFGEDMMAQIESHFAPFLLGDLPKNPLKAEYFLPAVPDSVVREGQGTVRVLPTPEKWYGMTYLKDLEPVRAAIRGMIEAGQYPGALWGEE